MNKNVALVTGASRGIGRGIALQLAADGYDIAFCYRSSEQEAQNLASEIEMMGRRVYGAKCDVTDFDSVSQFVQKIEEEFGEIKLLVNNAGITSDQALMRMSSDEWHNVIRTNLDSVFYFCRSVIFEFLKRKQGAIINLSSAAGVYGNAGQTNYASSKAGIIGFSKSLSKEVGSRGIRVNVVAPGFIQTDMTNSVSEKVIKKSVESTSLKRLGTVQDVAQLTSFLASEKASFITGQVLCIDGGLSI